jgi:hypothetical protein
MPTFAAYPQILGIKINQPSVHPRDLGHPQALIAAQ